MNDNHNKPLSAGHVKADVAGRGRRYERLATVLGAAVGSGAGNAVASVAAVGIRPSQEPAPEVPVAGEEQEAALSVRPVGTGEGADGVSSYARASGQEDCNVRESGNVMSDSKENVVAVPEPEPHHVSESEVQVLGVNHLVSDDGDPYTTVDILLGGHAGTVIDCDNDGIADYMLLDLNDNLEPDPGELFSLQDDNISMQALADLAGSATLTDVPDGSVAGNPDYVNNADISGFMA